LTSRRSGCSGPTMNFHKRMSHAASCTDSLMPGAEPASHAAAALSALTRQGASHVRPATHFDRYASTRPSPWCAASAHPHRRKKRAAAAQPAAVRASAPPTAPARVVAREGGGADRPTPAARRTPDGHWDGHQAAAWMALLHGPHQSTVQTGRATHDTWNVGIGRRYRLSQLLDTRVLMSQSSPAPTTYRPTTHAHMR
jgi:hypothetical protein